MRGLIASPSEPFRKFLARRKSDFKWPDTLCLCQNDRHPSFCSDEFCVAAVEEALATYGKPDIFNTDQGSQFTSAAFTELLQAHGIRISMDGRGRCLDTVCIERLWRALKYEAVYLNNYETGAEARVGIGKWMRFYNTLRPHSSLGGTPPDRFYFGLLANAA